MNPFSPSDNGHALLADVRRTAPTRFRSVAQRIELAEDSATALAAFDDLDRDYRDWREALRDEAAPPALTLLDRAGLVNSTSGDGPDWFVHGLISPGMVSMVAAVPKAGKSTFLFGLLKALESGDDFSGFPTRECRAILLSEEPASLLRAKAEAFDLQTCLYLSREHDPRMEFPDLIHLVTEEALSRGVGLVVVDTVAHFGRLGSEDEKGAGAGEVLIQPCLEAAGRGLAVILVHHHRKAPGEFGTRIRGSGSILAKVDVCIELGRIEGTTGNARTIDVIGRHPDCPTESLTIELRGGTYHRCGSSEEFRETYQAERLRGPIIAFLTSNPASSISRVKEELGGNAMNVGLALRGLGKTGVLKVEDGPRGARLYSVVTP